MQTIIFRVDGNINLGMGHIIRCLALANELKNLDKNLRILFLTKFDESRKIISERNYEVELVKDNEVEEIKNWIENRTILITDLWETENEFITALKEISDLKVICIDNNTKLKEIESDVLINANIFNEPDLKIKGTTKYYLGPSFMILRKEFSELREIKKIELDVKNILVIFGGTDSKGTTCKVMKALENINENIMINVITGPGFTFKTELDEIILNSNREFQIYTNPEDIAELMENADISVSAAGVVLYELACLGIPTIVIPQEPHQVDIAKAFEDNYVCLNLNNIEPDNKLIYNTTITLIEDIGLRKKLSYNAQKFVDGKGMERVIKIIKGEWET